MLVESDSNLAIDCVLQGLLPKIGKITSCITIFCVSLVMFISSLKHVLREVNFLADARTLMSRISRQINA